MKTRHTYQKNKSSKKTRRYKGGKQPDMKANATIATPTINKENLSDSKTTIDKGKVTTNLMVRQYKENIYHFVNSIDEKGYSDQELHETISNKYWEIYRTFDESSSNPMTKSKISKLIDFLQHGYTNYEPMQGKKNIASQKVLNKTIDIFKRLNTDPMIDPGLSNIKNLIFPEGKVKSGVSEIPTTIRKTTEIITDFYPNIDAGDENKIDPLTGKKKKPKYGRKQTVIKEYVEDNENMFHDFTSVEEWFRIMNEMSKGHQTEPPKQEKYTIDESMDTSFMGPPRTESSNNINKATSSDEETIHLNDAFKNVSVMDTMNNIGEKLTSLTSTSSHPPSKEVPTDVKNIYTSNQNELTKQKELLVHFQNELEKIKQTRNEETINKIVSLINEIKSNIDAMNLSV